MIRQDEDQQRKTQMDKGHQATAEEMVEIIQREKQALEARIQSHKDDMRAVDLRAIVQAVGAYQEGRF
jgi:transcription termination factor NusB